MGFPYIVWPRYGRTEGRFQCEDNYLNNVKILEDRVVFSSHGSPRAYELSSRMRPDVRVRVYARS